MNASSKALRPSARLEYRVPLFLPILKRQIPYEIIDSSIQKHGIIIFNICSGGGTADTPRSGRGALIGVRVQIPLCVLLVMLCREPHSDYSRINKKIT